MGRAVVRTGNNTECGRCLSALFPQTIFRIHNQIPESFPSQNLIIYPSCCSQKDHFISILYKCPERYDCFVAICLEPLVNFGINLVCIDLLNQCFEKGI